jgi:CheY-like chemotaxis protein
VVPVLTALVVDTDPDARRRVAGLLRLGGWQVQEATGVEDALLEAAVEDPDLVVTDVTLTGGDGISMLRRLRAQGSRARFVVAASEPSDAVRAQVLAAGALACLQKPIEARILLDFLRSRTTGPAAQALLLDMRDVEDMHDDDLDAELMDRLEEIYVDALPGRLAAIASGTRSGNTAAVASAAYTLAGTSGQLGRPEVASVCQAIAADARRGVLAHSRLVELQSLARSSA